MTISTNTINASQPNVVQAFQNERVFPSENGTSYESPLILVDDSKRKDPPSQMIHDVSDIMLDCRNDFVQANSLKLWTLITYCIFPTRYIETNLEIPDDTKDYSKRYSYYWFPPTKKKKKWKNYSFQQRRWNHNHKFRIGRYLTFEVFHKCFLTTNAIYSTCIFLSVYMRITCR